MNEVVRHFTEAVESLPATKPGLSDEARQAIIEHNRTMKDVRRFQAENSERIDAEWNALTSTPRTIEGHIAEGKADPVRWAELQREWSRSLVEGDLR